MSKRLNFRWKCSCDPYEISRLSTRTTACHCRRSTTEYWTKPVSITRFPLVIFFCSTFQAVRCPWSPPTRKRRTRTAPATMIWTNCWAPTRKRRTFRKGEIGSRVPRERSDNETNPCFSISSAELRHRKRMEQREKLEAQVRDMKRRQQANEQWTQLKRSLYKPLFIAGTIVLGGGLVAYLYFKD